MGIVFYIILIMQAERQDAGQTWHAVDFDIAGAWHRIFAEQLEFVVDMLTDLSGLLHLHFSVEEAHMKRLEMPEKEYSEHQNRHSEILDQCAQLNIDSYMDRDLTVRDIAALVRRWTIEHVVEYDLNIRKYLPAHA